MEKQQQPVFCSCHQGLASRMPEQGQHVRITLLKDVDVWVNDQRTVTSAGTSYEGTVTNVDPEGFFDLTTDAGFTKGFYAFDTTIMVEIEIPQQA